MWFGEVCSCCCLSLLPQFACNILATMYKKIFSAQLFVGRLLPTLSRRRRVANAVCLQMGRNDGWTDGRTNGRTDRERGNLTGSSKGGRSEPDDLRKEGRVTGLAWSAAVITREKEILRRLSSLQVGNAMAVEIMDGQLVRIIEQGGGEHNPFISLHG